jgi:hypothetical protein
MTDKQRKLIEFARSNGNKLTKQDAVNLIGGTYYCNGAKHTGDVLSRLVKSGFLIRIKPGVFELGKGKKENHTPTNPKQVNLF